MAKENPAALARRREAGERAAQRRSSTPGFFLSDSPLRQPIRFGSEMAARREGTTPQSDISTGGFVRAPGIPAQLKVRPEEARAGLGRAGRTVAKDSKAGRSILAARSDALRADIKDLRDQRPDLIAQAREGIAAYNELIRSKAARISSSDSPDEIREKLSRVSDQIQDGSRVSQSRTEQILQDEVVKAAEQFQRMQNATRKIQALQAMRDQISKELTPAEQQE